MKLSPKLGESQARFQHHDTNNATGRCISMRMLKHGFGLNPYNRFWEGPELCPILEAEDILQHQFSWLSPHHFSKRSLRLCMVNHMTDIGIPDEMAVKQDKLFTKI